MYVMYIVSIIKLTMNMRVKGGYMRGIRGKKLYINIIIKTVKSKF